MAYTAISQSDQTSCLNFLVGNTQRCLATDELLDFSKCDVYTNDNSHSVEEKKKSNIFVSHHLLLSYLGGS